MLSRPGSPGQETGDRLWQVTRAFQDDALVAAVGTLQQPDAGSRDAEESGKETAEVLIGGAVHGRRGDAQLQPIAVQAGNFVTRRARLHP
jgi:hypothetical protein